MPFRLSVVAGLLALFAFTAPATADPVEIYYAPVENLERADVALLQSARSKIDLTAFSLTDRPVIDALVDAHRRGVVVRVVLDPSEQHALDRLTEVADGIRMKPPSWSCLQVDRGPTFNALWPTPTARTRCVTRFWADMNEKTRPLLTGSGLRLYLSIRR